MSCGHCVATIKGALKERKVKADVRLSDQTVTVDFDENVGSMEQIKASIEEAGYEVSK